MAIKLPGDSGFLLGSDQIDLLAIIGKVSNAAKYAALLTKHIIPSPDGSIKTLVDAEQALKDGVLEVNPFNGRTVVIFVNDGATVYYEWSVEDQELHKIGRPVGNFLIEYTGANYTKFDNNGDVFNFNKSWFISVGCLTMHHTNAFQTLFSAGDNSFNWLAGVGNYGIYLDDREPVTQGGSSRQNTWTDPEMGRILLTYDHTSKLLYYYLGAQGSNPVKRILDIEQYQGDPVALYETPTELCIGKNLSGTGKLKGQLNELIGGVEYIDQNYVNDLYSGDGVDWTSFNKVTFTASMGEGDWPSGNTTGNVLTNMQMIGGGSDDYKPVPEE